MRSTWHGASMHLLSTCCRRSLAPWFARHKQNYTNESTAAANCGTVHTTRIERASKNFDRHECAVAQVAAVPDEHGRLIERLASAVATSFSEAPHLLSDSARESSTLERCRPEP